MCKDFKIILHKIFFNIFEFMKRWTLQICIYLDKYVRNKYIKKYNQFKEKYIVLNIIFLNISQLVNAITIKKDQLEILISLIIFVNHLVIMFLCNHTAQILINNNEEFFHEL